MADELERLDALRKAGTLSDDEFSRAKATVLNGSNPAEPVAEHLAEIRHQNELARIDREWEIERTQYLVVGRHGIARVPTPWGGLVAAALGGGFGVFWTLGAFAMTRGMGDGPGPFGLVKLFPVFGIVFTVAAVWFGFHAYSKGVEYERAFAAYRQRRAEAEAE